MPSAALISVLARSLMAGEATPGDAYTRSVRTLGREWRWLGSLVARYIETFSGQTRPRHRDVVRFLREDSGFTRARFKYRDQLHIAEWIPEPSRMLPAAAAAHWNLPRIEALGDLADWLSLTPSELDWYADLKDLNNRSHNFKLQHYHYRLLPKRTGGVRLTEIPKPNLKELQRRVLHGILDRIPVHPAAHAYVHGRSIATFASPHVDKAVLLRLDFEDFFPSFPGARVQTFFRTLGYPESIADALGGICTNSVPRRVLASHPYETRSLFSRPHLPQGAPTSPALANLMAYRLDCRLSGLANSAGLAYTRYADDLAFSGEDFSPSRFALHAAAIAMEEGFSVNHHKTRILGQGVRQHLAGVVVNQTASPSRKDLELLEAILTNCVRRGPDSQNRGAHPNFRAHLEGRIGFVEMIHREKGRRLRALFQRIQWPPR